MSALVFRAGEVTSKRLADVSGGRALDDRALVSRMLLHPPYVRGDTLYRGVTVMHASCMVPRIAEVPLDPSVADAVARVRAALEAAADRALDGTRRVAVLTGGGLDSSALLALALARAKLTGGTVFGVALDFGGAGDDRPHLRALEEKLGCEILRVRPEEAAHHGRLLQEGVDATPLTWPGAAMEIELMTRAREHGAERVLTGAGADDLFDGEPRALAELARHGHILRAIASARALRGFGETRAPIATWIARPLAARLVPRPVRAWRAQRTMRASHAPWLGDRANALVRSWRRAQIARTFDDDDAQARLASRLEAPHLEHLAWLRHQEEVGSGVERCDPYLDPELVAAVTRLPRALLLHGNVRRGLFREVARDWLPETLRTRVDKAAFEPAFARFAASIGGLASLASLAAVPALAARGLLEPRAFREAFDAFARAPDDPMSEGWGTVWPVLAVEAFLQHRAL